MRRADHTTPLYPQKLVLSSPTSGSRSVGIVRSRTQATEFVCFLFQFPLPILIHTFISQPNFSYRLDTDSVLKQQIYKLWTPAHQCSLPNSYNISLF
jgi:hypothetical protein